MPVKIAGLEVAETSVSGLLRVKASLTFLVSWSSRSIALISLPFKNATSLIAPWGISAGLGVSVPSRIPRAQRVESIAALCAKLRSAEAFRRASLNGLLANLPSGKTKLACSSNLVLPLPLNNPLVAVAVPLGLAPGGP